MTRSEITDTFHALSVSDPKYLLFRPEVPRYLFRVFTPKSRGETNRIWTKSMDATDGNQNSRVDIFTRESKEEVAGMLYRHLRWFPGPEDNLVLWTSSILFALVYIFHLRANTRNGSAFDNISFCIIDTTEFPKEVFMRDMDLIQAYLQYSKDLQDFKGLRSRNDYHFGEYLSQGALKIEDRCKIVSAQAMIDRGLYGLRYEFEEFSLWEPALNPPWANPTKDLRKVLHNIGCAEEREQRIEVAFSIVQLFKPRWVLPVASNLVALLPYPEEDVAIMRAFQRDIVIVESRDSSSPLKTKIVAYDALPKVVKFSKIMLDIYIDLPNTEIKRRILAAENQLRRAVQVMVDLSSEYEGLGFSDYMQYAIIERLDTEAAVNQLLRDTISSRQVIFRR